MRTLSLDIGDTRTGIAISNPEGTVASPLDVLETRELLRNGTVLQRVFCDYDVEHVVIGLPLSLNGEEGPQARHVRSLAKKLLVGCGWITQDDDVSSNGRVSFFDERFSSAEAKRVMADSQYRSKQMRGSLDKIAAAIILQSFLEQLSCDKEED